MSANPDDEPTADSSRLCVDLAIDVPSAAHGQSIYTYLVPRHLEQRLEPGLLVWAPVRREASVALVERVHQEPPDIPLKPVTALVKPVFKLTEKQFGLARWIARQTASTLFASASPFFPPGVQHEALAGYELVNPEDPALGELTGLRKSIVELLRERGYLSAGQIKRALGRSGSTVLASLEEAGLIERSLAVVDRQPKATTVRHARLVSFDLDAVSRSDKQRRVLVTMEQRRRLLGDRGQLFPIADLIRQTGTSTSIVTALERKGLIEVTRLPAGALTEPVEAIGAPVLTAAQASAWRTIETGIRERDSQPILLYGVTGSGKTEMYLRMAGRSLRENRGAIILVPEIALATQVVTRFEERFPGQVAVLHSAQNAAERYQIWTAIARGERSIVVGPRSALFAPLPDIGCIAIDEEQDSAYKQDADPRYHARALAEQMASVYEATLVLGSATPSIETAFRTTRGDVRRIDLPERVRFDAGGIDSSLDRQSLAMPSVTIIDMRAEARVTGATLISTALEDGIRQTLEHRKQAIVLLNRRGLATVVICRSCGRSIDCPRCDIPMVYHRDLDRMVCHRCNSRSTPASECPICGGPYDYFGAGTQRIEQEMKRFFPGSRVLRVDRDSIKQLGGYARVLSTVANGDVDIVVGTQLVAKGLDFPRVATVGVLQADSQLYFPDYRSAERTYQLVSQVAGRAGRRTSEGHVFVQTYTPGHYAIVAAARHSYEDFYTEEIAFRQRFRYPPFSRLARYTFRHASEPVARDESMQMAADLIQHADTRLVKIDLLGPAPAYAARIGGEYQWQLILRTSDPGIEAMLDGLPARPGWIVDIDPSSML